MATKSTQELYVDNKFFSSPDMLKFARELTIPKADIVLKKIFFFQALLKTALRLMFLNLTALF